MKYLCLLCSVFFCVALSAQPLKSKDVPEKMVKALEKQFKYSRKVNWMMQDSLYKAEFESVGKQGYALFTEKGRFVESGIAVDASALLFSINHYLRQNYPDDEPDLILKTKNARKEVYYVVEVAEDRLVFDDLGQLVSKETIEPDTIPAIDSTQMHQE